MTSFHSYECDLSFSRASWSFHPGWVWVQNETEQGRYQVSLSFFFNWSKSKWWRSRQQAFNVDAKLRQNLPLVQTRSQNASFVTWNLCCSRQKSLFCLDGWSDRVIKESHIKVQACRLSVSLQSKITWPQQHSLAIQFLRRDKPLAARWNFRPCQQPRLVWKQCSFSTLSFVPQLAFLLYFRYSTECSTLFSCIVYAVVKGIPPSSRLSRSSLCVSLRSERRLAFASV